MKPGVTIAAPGIHDALARLGLEILADLGDQPVLHFRHEAGIPCCYMA
jgi:hypothetical protein